MSINCVYVSVFIVCLSHTHASTEQVRVSGGKILVHCMAGVSRSSTICIAYIMATQKIRMEQAYEFVKSRRRCVSPNFHFMEQLLTFESCVFNSPKSLTSNNEES